MRLAIITLDFALEKDENSYPEVLSVNTLKRRKKLLGILQST